MAINLDNFGISTGRLAREPKIFPEHKDGSKSAALTLAVDRNYVNANGERTTDYLDFSVFIPKPAADGTKSAMERAIERCSKGALVRIAYEPRSNSYQSKKSGEMVYENIKVVQEIRILETKAAREAREAAAATADAPAAPEATEDKPF